MEISLEKLAQNVIAAREKRGMSAEMLAREIRESVQTVADIEEGKIEMSLEIALSICYALNISINELLADIGVKA